jgi:hypothetical protein
MRTDLMKTRTADLRKGGAGWRLAGLTGGAAVAMLIAAPVALAAAGPPSPPAAPSLPAASVAPLAPRLMSVPPALALLLQDVATDRVVTGDHTVAEGDSIGDVVVVGGTLRVLGEITGDAVVVGGDLIVESTGRILGDAVVTGGTIRNEGGTIVGEMRTLDGNGAIAAEVRRAVIGGTAAATATREATRASRAEGARRVETRREHAWFDPIRRGVVGVISTLALGLVLAGLGAAVIFYGRTYLDTVSDTLRASVPRSLATGLAAGFLLVPAFVVMVVALAVTIIGIPLLIVAVPLFPLAVVGAIAFGLVAAAHAIGERTAEQREHFDMRYRNAYAYMATGLAMLLAPLLAAHLLGMTGFLGFVSTLLKGLTVAVIWATATAGFGAVLLSRGGTRRTFARPLAPEPDFEMDPLFDDEPTPPGRHV